MKHSQNFYKFAALQGGVPFSVIKTWYLTILERKIAYAWGIWYPRKSAAHGRRHLLAMQITCLLELSRTYRNAATSTLQVLTGIPPITRKLVSEAANTQILRLGKTVPGIDIDRKEVAIATKVSKYKTDSYTEYFHKILLKDYTGELQVYTGGSKN